MKSLLTIALAVGTIGFAAPAVARQGCGGGFHRGPYGHCRPNAGTAVIYPGRPVIGVYYPNRGYWHGGRYWERRYHHNGGWRYR